MKRSITQIQKLTLALAAAISIAGCAGGEDDETITGPSYEGACYPSMVCTEIDPEFCTQAGCELRRDAENTPPTCAGENPTACDVTNAEECVQIRGCSWAGSYGAS